MPELNEALPLQDFLGLLQQSLGESLVYEVVDWKHLTDPGENFGSLILAVNVNITKDGKQEIYHFVCKMPPKSEYLLDLFNSPMTFKKELYFYKKIAPAFLELQLNNGIGENDLIKLVPQFYGGRLSLTDAEKFDGQAAIILENLNYSGYSTQDRLAGMDLEHMKYAVRELAKLHAITCGYRIKNPKDFNEIIAPGLIPSSGEITDKCVMEMIHKAVENLKKMDEAKPYMDKVIKTIEYCEITNEEPEPQTEHWCTFLHNDFWVNNMMYRYGNNGKILGMKMVDFQLSVYDYGIKDLIFFLVSSGKKEIIDTKIHDLITLYYESFIETLKALQVDTKAFPRDEFERLVKLCAPFKLSQCAMMVQVIKATRGSAPDVNSIKNEEAFLSIGKGELYNDKLLHVVQTFARNGWLID